MPPHFTSHTSRLELKPFDLNRIKHDKTAIIVGGRGTGKSTLVADILYHHKRINHFCCMSGSEEGNFFYQKFMPNLFVYEDFEPEVLENTYELQRRRTVQKHPDPDLLILLDDLMFDKRVTRSEIIRKVFMNGRQFHILFMMTCHYIMDIHPAIRANTDYLFMFQDNHLSNLKKAFIQFFGVFPQFDQFRDAFNACTENFECLVLDNTCKSNRIEDCVFYYKAKFPVPKFQMGNSHVWNYHKKHYNTRYATKTQKTSSSSGGTSVQIIKKSAPKKEKGKEKEKK